MDVKVIQDNEQISLYLKAVILLENKDNNQKRSRRKRKRERRSKRE
jgi:hypothetical protein